jgi:hypothetical protein
MARDWKWERDRHLDTIRGLLRSMLKKNLINLAQAKDIESAIDRVTASDKIIEKARVEKAVSPGRVAAAARARAARAQRLEEKMDKMVSKWDWSDLENKSEDGDKS